MGLNQFGDLTADEFLKYATGFKNTTINKLSSENQNYIKIPSEEPLRDSVDWRTEGIVSEVKNQMQCGACYAFSAAGGIEGQLAKKTGILITLSAQNLIDCSLSYGNNGCEGGRVDSAFAFVKDYGIESDFLYPYTDSVNPCTFSANLSETSIINYAYLESGNEIILQHAIDKVGPISVSIDMPSNMQFYEQGVYYHPECSSTEVKHTALVVGYGKVDDIEYYILKNSWSIDWGEEGYLKLLGNYNNHCGIATYGIYPIL